MPRPNVHFAFDHTSPEAERYARTRSAALLSTLADREPVRGVVGRAFSENMTPARTAREIRSVVGLLPNQIKARDNLRALLTPGSSTYAGDGALVYAGRTRIRIPEDGMDEDLIDQRCDEYADRLLNQRCRMIARTELLGASNEGTQEAWQQAVDEGLLTGGERREWLYTEGLDKVPCPICEGMDGQRVELDMPFLTPDGDEVMNPPAHPNCRCGQGLVTEAERQREIESEQEAAPTDEEATLETASAREMGGPGSGNFGHAGRPGEIGGSSEGEGRTSATQDRVSSFASEARSMKGEKILAVDRQGRTLLSVSGERGQVQIGQKELDSMHGAAVVMHNHPHGGSFSGGDFRTACMTRPTEFVAVTKTAEYALSAGGSGWPNGDTAYAVYTAAKKRAMKKLGLTDAQLVEDADAQRRVGELATKDAASELGLGYSVNGEVVVAASKTPIPVATATPTPAPMG